MKRPQLSSLYFGFALLFLYVPLLALLLFSFNASRYSVWQGWSLAWYRSALSNRELREALTNSVLIAIASAAISTVIGTLCAYALWKRRSRLITGALYVSLLTPEVVSGVSLLAVFEWGFHFLHLRLGMHTVVLAHVAFSVAYVVLVVGARMRGFDPALEEAAFDLGASEWNAFRRVTFPFLMPAVIAAALLAVVVSFDDYVTTSLVAGVDSETLPMVMYAIARRGISPELNAISAVMTVVIGTLILLSERLRQR